MKTYITPQCKTYSRAEINVIRTMGMNGVKDPDVIGAALYKAMVAKRPDKTMPLFEILHSDWLAIDYLLATNWPDVEVTHVHWIVLHETETVALQARLYMNDLDTATNYHFDIEDVMTESGRQRILETITATLEGIYADYRESL